MATLTTGFTWADGNQITSARLNNTVNLATIANIIRSDLKTDEFSGVSIGNNSPASPNAGELWFNTSLGTNEGVLHYYDGSRWVPVQEHVIGYNTTGSTIAAGSLVKLKTSTTSSLGMRQEIQPTTSKHDRALGILLNQTVDGATGVVLTKGRLLLAKKLSGTAVTAGDPIVPSSTSGAATSGATTNYGPAFGNAIGIWTNDAASGATTGEVYVWGPRYASFVAYDLSPTQVLTADTPTALDTWSGSFGSPVKFSWSETPPGVVARLVEVRAWDVTAAATRLVSVGVRQVNSAMEVGSGAPSIAAAISTQAVTADAFALAGQLWIPTNPDAADGDKGEYKVQDKTTGGADGTVANIRVSIWELGVMLGGRVV